MKVWDEEVDPKYVQPMSARARVTFALGAALAGIVLLVVACGSDGPQAPVDAPGAQVDACIEDMATGPRDATARAICREVYEDAIPNG